MSIKITYIKFESVHTRDVAELVGEVHYADVVSGLLALCQRKNDVSKVARWKMSFDHQLLIWESRSSSPLKYVGKLNANVKSHWREKMDVLEKFIMIPNNVIVIEFF